MAQTKIGALLEVLDAGGHVMGRRASYYDAKAIRDGMRANDWLQRARAATKNYRVRVEECRDGAGRLTVSTFNRSHSVTL